MFLFTMWHDHFADDDGATPDNSESLPSVSKAKDGDRVHVDVEIAGDDDKEDEEEEEVCGRILLAFFESELQSEYLRMATRLREQGWCVEFYPEPAKLKKQLKYADQKKIPAVVLIGSDEWSRQAATVKWLFEDTQDEVSLADDGQHLINYFQQRIGR